MSKIIDNLLVEDFGKSLDANVFKKWKTSLNDLQQAQNISTALTLVGMVSLLAVGFIGVVIFFILAIIGLIIVLPKRSVARKYRLQLGVTNSELSNAIVAARKRMRNK